jgi:hypothetical protein
MNCKNCRKELAETDGYCSNCGGKVIHNRLTLPNLFHHINETYFNYDNKLLRTFTKLFSQPEDVINGYINGVRKKYVDVVSYFALAITLAGFQIFVFNKIGIDFSSFPTNKEQAEMQRTIAETIYQYASDYQSLVMMLYIPLYAWIAMLIFRRYRKFNYTELLVVFMYGQAQVSILSACIGIAAASFGTYSLLIAGYIILLFQFIYFTYMLKRVYGLTAKQILIRTLLFLLLMLVFMIIAMILTAVVMWRMGLYDA